MEGGWRGQLRSRVFSQHAQDPGGQDRTKTESNRTKKTSESYGISTLRSLFPTLDAVAWSRLPYSAPESWCNGDQSRLSTWFLGGSDPEAIVNVINGARA